jgi:hypothetical protein
LGPIPIFPPFSCGIVQNRIDLFSFFVYLSSDLLLHFHFRRFSEVRTYTKIQFCVWYWVK